jgi:hypothetical protein
MSLPNAPQPPGVQPSIIIRAGRALIAGSLQAFRWIVRVLGPKGSVAIPALLLIAFAFFWAWDREEWRPFVSAAAGGLAALLAALTRLLKDDEAAAKWILTIGAVAFSAAFSWYTTTTLTNKLAEQTEIARHLEARLQLLKDDAVDYAQQLPKEDTPRILTAAGAKLRDRFNAVIGRKPPFHVRDFDPSEDLIYIIKKLDPYNGHALYLSGEIERSIGGLSKGRQRFYEYLEQEKGRTRNGEVGITACRNPEGFCRERTAWIFHLLALDFYQYGKNLKSTGHPAIEYQAAFSTALKHACSAIAYFPPNGFGDALQGTATRALEKALSDELGQGCEKKAEPK